MQSQLTIKHFGPVREATLDLRDINVFIGPQASGKSTIAKLYTICKSPLAFLQKPSSVAMILADEGDESLSDVRNFRKALEDYNVRSFLRSNSEIRFSNALHDFSYKDGKIHYHRKLLEKINEFEVLLDNIQSNAADIAGAIQHFCSSFIVVNSYIDKLLNISGNTDADAVKNRINSREITPDSLHHLLAALKETELALSIQPARYIPAERSFIPIIKSAALSLQHENVPIPRHVLAFGAEVERAAFEQPELDLSFVQPGVRYVFENGMDMIYFGGDRPIRLTEAASGFQTLVPMLLPIMLKSKKDRRAHHSFVIEEPELNLFPKAQYELMKKLTANRMPAIGQYEDMGEIHTYTTHSPFVLAALNNMLYAYIVINKLYDYYSGGKKIAETDEMEALQAMGRSIAETEKILPRAIAPASFSAYQVADGTAMPILNRETGLIEDNYLDDVSHELGDDFDALMQLMPGNEK